MKNNLPSGGLFFIVEWRDENPEGSADEERRSRLCLYNLAEHRRKESAASGRYPSLSAKQDYLQYGGIIGLLRKI